MIVLTSLVLVLVLPIGLGSNSDNVEELWTIGFGVISPRAMIVGWAVPSVGTTGLIANTLIAD